MNENIIHKGEHTLIHNPGYDFKRVLDWLEKDPPKIAPYFIPIIGLLSACFSVEGYINMVGQNVDTEWKSFDEKHVTLKDRLKRIYEKIDVKLECGKGIWQEVLWLFDMRNRLVHPTYKNEKEVRKDKIPDIFEEAAEKYPLSITKRVLEEAISTLLADSKLNDYPWKEWTYSG